MDEKQKKEDLAWVFLHNIENGCYYIELYFYIQNRKKNYIHIILGMKISNIGPHFNIISQ